MSCNTHLSTRSFARPFIVELVVDARGVVILGAWYTTCGRSRLHLNMPSTRKTESFSAALATPMSTRG